MEKDFSTAKWVPVDTATGRKLREAIKDKNTKGVMSDYWSPYEKFVPKGMHTQSKAETYTVEGYSSLFRHFLPA